MSISPIGGVGFTPYVPPVVAPTVADPTTSGAGGVSAPSGSGFGQMLVDGIDHLQQVQGTSDKLAVQAATGDLTAIHQYTIAATEASVTTQLTVAMRNKALEAFNEIMRMPVG
ncbi:flagellar hook-basal body complex protein FliE [Lapillicoccus jejuensis]|uniref:Flagellar hook-basal body complex protein FliE n=1 Tax=Lapillicoccus jejuensis TaxID=402171 RepID=A0A542E4C7_9MICO|nr:flagellar hook-basal body complex protein FliE [Lapillicoccus jejuensis]TQJ10167.1 flagellar hook-basal body complex protein FliE [Lapillicoccus jejuensis]